MSESPLPSDDRDGLSEERLQHYRARVAGDYYDDPTVIARLVDSMLGSGALGDPEAPGDSGSLGDSAEVVDLTGSWRFQRP